MASLNRIALALSCATFAQPVVAEGNSVRLGVSARIAAFFRLQVDHQLDRFTVTALGQRCHLLILDPPYGNHAIQFTGRYTHLSALL